MEEKSEASLRLAPSLQPLLSLEQISPLNLVNQFATTDVHLLGINNNRCWLPFNQGFETMVWSVSSDPGLMSEPMN